MKKGSLRVFTEEQAKFVRDNYKNMTSKEIAAHLGCDYRQVTRYVNERLHVRKTFHFTDDDLQFIRDNYGRLQAKEIAQILGCPFSSVRYYASQMLHIRKNRVWTKEEDDVIKKYYCTYKVTAIAEMINRKPEHIQKRAHIIKKTFGNVNNYGRNK